MNQFGLPDSAMTVIIDGISSRHEIEKAIIFGSRVIGNYKKGSDIDIALFGTMVTFGITTDLSADLNERTTQPYFFDLINFNSIDNVAMKKHIEEFGKIIFDRSTGYPSNSISS
ncbi:MAG: nucleotidyltransferase domain-containing protein [Bacteroidota bacterium]